MGFLSPAAGGAIFTVPTTTSGLAFIGCHFDGRSSTAATIAISATAVEQLTIQDCRFFGKFSTATINIGAGASRALLIKDNIIESGAIGIAVDSSATCADAIGIIANNIIKAVTLCIDENSDKFAVVGNRGCTAANSGATTMDYSAVLGSDNQFTSGNGTLAYPATNFGAQS